MLARRMMIASVAALTSFGALGLAPLARTTNTAAETFSVDPVHSSMVFRVKHNNVAYFYGRFNDISGAISLDSANEAGSSLEVSVKTESVDTGNEKRNGHLKSPDFFNAAKFPACTFKSTKFAKASGDAFDVTGDLTIHGVTKPVTVKFEKTGQAKNPRGGELIGFESTFTISRKDFGITFMPDGIGDDVRVSISLEAGKK